MGLDLSHRAWPSGWSLRERCARSTWSVYPELFREPPPRVSQQTLMSKPQRASNHTAWLVECGCSHTPHPDPLPTLPQCLPLSPRTQFVHSYSSMELMEQVPCAYGLNGGSPDARAPLSQEYPCLVDRLDPEHSIGIFAT